MGRRHGWLNPWVYPLEASLFAWRILLSIPLVVNSIPANNEHDVDDGQEVVSRNSFKQCIIHGVFPKGLLHDFLIRHHLLGT